MPMLALDGTDVPLLYQPIAGETREFGDTETAYDGGLMTRIRARKKQWQCVTRWLSASDATALYTILTSSPPVNATGDLTGTTTVIIQNITEQTHTLAGGARYRAFSFTMRQA